MAGHDDRRRILRAVVVMKPGSTRRSGWLDAEEPSAEVRAVLACARAVLDRAESPALLAAVTACRSVEGLCRTAAAHGMLGHLHRLVSSLESGTVDSALRQRLTELHGHQVARNLHDTGRLLRILEMLRTEGVEAMPIKGPAWAEMLYGDLALRSWTDLDLLVRHEQVMAAREVLLGYGFVDSGQANERIARRRRGSLGQIALRSSKGNLHLELHWEVTVGMSPRSLGADSVFARAGSIRLLGRAVPCPGTIDLFLITCLDGTRDRWDRAEKLLGLGVQIWKAQSLDWEALMSAARETGCERRVIVAVSHGCRTLGLSMPPQVERLAGGDLIARALARSLVPRESQGGSRSGPRGELAQLLWSFATEDRLTISLRHVAVRVLRPGPGDWGAIALPDWAAWLYYPIRQGRLWGKWLTLLLGGRKLSAKARLLRRSR